MGKSLIIPGADFSQNKISESVDEYYFTEGTDIPEASAISINSNALLASENMYQSLKNKTVN